MICPNINSREWQTLTSKVPESVAYYLWDKYQGDVPASAITQEEGKVDFGPMNEAASKLDNTLRQTLANLGISYKAVEAVKDPRGQVMTAVARADMFNKVVEVVEGRADATTLPEETSHFFVEALDKNGHVYKGMYDNITKFPEYSEVVEEYGALSDYTEEDLRKEAMAKVLAKEIINQSQESTLEPKLQKMLSSWWNMVMSKLKQMFSRYDAAKMNNAMEEFAPYRDLANKILNQDLSEFSSPINSSKSYYQLSNAPTAKQKETLEAIKKGAEGITKQGQDQDRGYYKDGKKLGESVTTRRDKIFMAKYKNRPIDPEREARMKQAGQIGTLIHDDIDNIVKRELANDMSVQRVVKSDPATYAKLEAYVRELGKMHKGAIFLAEQLVYDPKSNTPGTVDLIVINPSGTVDIYDWKTMTLDKIEKEDYGEPARWKTEKYEYQLNQYKKILAGYGIKTFGKVRYVPIESRFKVNKTTGKRDFIGIDIGRADTSKNIDKSYLNPVPVSDEKTGEEDIDNLLLQLRALHSDVSTKKTTSPIEIKKKQQRIKQLTRAIRELQLNKNFAGFVVSADVEFQAATARLADTKNPPTENELVDMKERLSVYTDLSSKFKNLYADGKINNEHKRRFDKISEDAARLINQVNKSLEVALIKAAGEVGISEATLEKFSEQGSKALGPVTKIFKAISRIDHPLFRTLWNLVNKAKLQTKKDSDALTNDIKTRLDALKEWGKNKGLKGTAIFSMMLDKKQGKLISKYSEEYYKTRMQKIKAGDWQWVKNNSVIEETKLKKYIEDQKNFIETHVFSSDKEYNKAVRATKLKELQEKFNVFDNPKAFLNPDPYFQRYLKPKDTFFSTQYKELLQPQNKEALDFYNFFVEKVREFNQFMPLSGEGKWVNPDRFIPNIKESLLEQVMNSGGGASISGLKEKFSDMFSFQEDGSISMGAINPLTGEYERKIPVYYTRELPPEEKSYDLGRVLMLFGDMAYNYKYMSEIEGSVRNLRNALQDSKETMVDGLNNALRDPYSKEVQTKLVSADTLKQFDDYIGYYLYGIKQSDNLGSFTKSKVVKNAETGEEEIVESQYSYNKLASAGLRAFAVKALGLNFISQTANLAGGIMNTMILGTGGNFFTKSQIAKSMSMLASGNLNPKVMAIKEVLNLRGDNDLMKRANDVSVNDLARKMDIDKVFWLQEKADQIIFNNVGIAMMMNFGKDKDGAIKRLDKLPKGTESLLDMIKLDANGKPNFSEVFGEEEFRKFRNKIQAIGEKITGMSTRDNVSGYRMTVLGQSLMQFRGWIPRTLSARLGATYYDAELEVVETGRYRSLYTQLMNRKFIPMLGELVTGLATGVYGQNTKDAIRTAYLKFLDENPQVDPNEVTEEMFYDMHVSNLRSNAMEAALIIAFSMLVAGIKEAWDDDDEDKRFKTYTLKMLNRWSDELKFYISPTAFQNITKGAVPAVGLVNDIYKFFESLFTEGKSVVTGDDEMQDYNSPSWQFVKSFVPGGNTAWQWFGEQKPKPKEKEDK